MTKNRLRFHKCKNLSTQRSRKQAEETYSFPPEKAFQLAKTIFEAFGPSTYQYNENHDHALSRALKSFGIRPRTHEEEVAWKNATPEERAAAHEKHRAGIQKMISSGKCTELFAPADRPFHAPEKSQYVFFEDITLSL